MIRDSGLHGSVSLSELVLTSYSAPQLTDRRRDEVLVRSRPRGHWGPWGQGNGKEINKEIF